MLAAVPVPLPDAATEQEIGDLVLKANELRSDAWGLERDAIGEVSEVVG